MKKISGFTLIELMISLALGLIIVLVAVQMLLSGQKSLAFQTAMVDVQDNANIGLNYVVSDLKLTNLNLLNRDMKNTGISGLVVSASNYPITVTAGRALSSSGDADASTQAEKSDVLVIQYRPAIAGGYDCEGTLIESTQEIIVQRYFLRRDDNGAVHDLALACDAGRYTATGAAVSGFNADSTKGGQIIMPRIDHFKVLVGVEDLETQKMTYMTLSQFAALPAAASADKGKRAVSLQVGLLARSIDSSGSNSPEQTQYSLLNETYSVYKPDTMTTKFIRIPVEQTVALKNGLGER